MKSDNDLQATNENIKKEQALETRIKLLIEDNDWEEALNRCERLLELNPDNGNGRLFKLLAEQKAGSAEELLKNNENIIHTEAWSKAIEFLDEDFRKRLTVLTDEIEEKQRKAIADNDAAELRKAIADNEKLRDAEGAGKLKPLSSDPDGFGKRINTFKDKGLLLSYLYLALTIVSLVAAIIYCNMFIWGPKSSFEKACSIIQTKDYEKASKKLGELNNYPDAIIKQKECILINNKRLLDAKLKQSEHYIENNDYYNAVVLLRQVGFYNDAHSKTLDCLASLNGDPNIIREAKIYTYKEIEEKLIEDREKLRKSLEEIERKEAEKEAEIEREKREIAEIKAMEERIAREEAEEAIRLKQQEIKEKLEEEQAKEEGKRAEKERIAKETEKRRAAMKVTLGQNKVISVNGYNITLIACPEGTFTMGSPANEVGRNSDEIQHQVTISQGFYIGKFEVTQGLYKAVTGMNPARNFIKGDNKPVYQVSWFMANEFCDKLNKLTRNTRPAHWHFDLPTEAQWEYACRAGYPTAINNGGSLAPNNNNCPALAQAAWYSANTPARQLSDVGCKQANCWYICDMHGGVWEWCKDYYGNYPSKPALNPCRLDGYKKVLRGGSIRSKAKDCRSAARRGSVPGNDGNGEYDIGFRLVLVADSYEKTFQADE